MSRRQVDPGNLIKGDDTTLTTIKSQNPLYVYFDIDERTLLRLRRLMREGTIKSYQEAKIPVLVALSDETDYPHTGLVDFRENAVDPGTGTLRARPRIDNPPPYVLTPGLFVRVRLPVGARLNTRRSSPKRRSGRSKGRNTCMSSERSSTRAANHSRTRRAVPSKSPTKSASRSAGWRATAA